MNKAFVREPDSSEEFCPRCGVAGQSVSRATIAAFVAADTPVEIADVANFCPTPQCEVAYFDMFERVILASSLKHIIFPKDFAAPICSCFGLTADDIDQDVAEGVNTRTKACVARAQSPEARCAELAPNGRSCVAEVKRYFMQRRKTD